MYFRCFNFRFKAPKICSTFGIKTIVKILGDLYFFLFISNHREVVSSTILPIFPKTILARLLNIQSAAHLNPKWEEEASGVLFVLADTR